MKKVILFLCLLGSLSFVDAQSLKLETFISQDSIKIGEGFNVSLKVEHDESKKLFFPNSDTDFGKWELISKKVFPSYYSKDSLVIDSVVYSLRTFEISDSVPVFLDLYKGLDSTLVRSKVKWVHHKSGVIASKGNQVLSDNSYEEIPRLFDEQILIAILIILGLVAVYFFFVWLPKHLKKKRIERFVKKHSEFSSAYSFHSSWANSEWGVYYSSWKKDISSSEKINVQGFTSRKLATHFNDKNLSLVFRKLEQILYDPESKVLLDESDFKRLENLSESKYLNQLNEMQNDK